MSTIPPAQGSLAESARTPGRGSSLFCALTAAAAPAITLVFLLLFSPGAVERQVAAYTGTFFAKFQAGLASVPVWKWEWFHFWAVYAERTLLETLVRTYNSLPQAIGLSLAAAAIAVALRAFAAKKQQRRFTAPLETAAALPLFCAAAALAAVPRPVPVGAALTLLYALNFPYGPALADLAGAQIRRSRSWLLVPSLAALPHVLFPAAFFAAAGPAARGLPLLLGRACVCLFGFPLISVLATSSAPASPQPGVKLLLPEYGLYDILVDKAGNQLLVTQKRSGSGWQFRLDDLAPAGRFTLPTGELENLAFDPARREIYHVDRDTGRILAVDAGTMKVLRSGKMPVPSSGSTKAAFSAAAGRLLVSWENDNLFAADRDTLNCRLLGSPGNVNPLSDDRSSMAYYNSERDGSIVALDLSTLKVVASADGPRRGERMALSPARGELFVPDPLGAKIWVYSAPGLELLRKLPAQLGVRPIAVDDEHGLLISASIVTGHLEAADPVTGRVSLRRYVGKYGRIIKLDTSARRAFLTATKDGLYAANY